MAGRPRPAEKTIIWRLRKRAFRRRIPIPPLIPHLSIHLVRALCAVSIPRKDLHPQLAPLSVEYLLPNFPLISNNQQMHSSIESVL